jgi:hypothetical protein
MPKEPSQEQPDSQPIPSPKQEQLAQTIYDGIIYRCRRRVQELTTIQFDPETGVRRYFFNGKLERITRVRGYQKD